MIAKEVEWPADANEAQLRTDMTSAMRASTAFSEWLFRRAIPKAESVKAAKSAEPHVEQRLTNSIIDIDVRFKGLKDYRVGIELKNATAPVQEAQLRSHLIGLKIMQQSRSVLTAAASDKKRVLKLLVVTGSAMEPEAVTKLRALKGFDDKIRWVSWHDVVDAIASLPEKDQNNPNVKPLIQNLNSLGFSSREGRVPKLPALDALTKLIARMPQQEEFNDDDALLTSFLNRVEFEMSNSSFAPTREIRIKKQGRKVHKDEMLHSVKDLREKVWGFDRKRRIGRFFVPNQDVMELKRAESNTKIEYGVGVYLDLVENRWECRLIPRKGSTADIKRFKGLASRERELVSSSSHPTWKLTGTQLTPKRMTEFMIRVWNAYEKK